MTNRYVPSPLGELREQCTPPKTAHKPKAATDIQLLAVVEELREEIASYRRDRRYWYEQVDRRLDRLEDWRSAMHVRSFFSRLFGWVK